MSPAPLTKATSTDWHESLETSKATATPNGDLIIGIEEKDGVAGKAIGASRACTLFRDVSSGEDKCHVKLGHAPQNLAAFRNAAISVVRVCGHKEIAATLRDFSYRPLKLLKFLGIMKN